MYSTFNDFSLNEPTADRLPWWALALSLVPLLAGLALVTGNAAGVWALR